jgi:hypothetical protein
VKVERVLQEVADVERELAQHLVRFAERHAAEHDLYHTGHTLAQQCQKHLDALAPFAEQYSAPAPDTDIRSPGLLEKVRRAASDAVGRSEVTSLVLMRDMRDLYLSIQEAEMMWVVLVQVSQAVRDGKLLNVAVECHEAAEMRGKWIRTRVKESAPQVYST